MRIQIFNASMASGYASIQREVNQWIEENEDVFEIVSITPTVCTVGPSEDMFQAIMMTVVYQSRY